MGYANIVRNRKMKLCPTCNKVKPICGDPDKCSGPCSYYRDASRADSHGGNCKVCKRQQMRLTARKRRKRERLLRKAKEATA